MNGITVETGAMICATVALVAALWFALTGRAVLYGRACLGSLGFYSVATVCLAIRHDWPEAAFGAAVIAFCLWHRNRRRRRRRRAALGAKARALRARLVRTMRERSAPRPVLRPAPVPR